MLETVVAGLSFKALLLALMGIWLIFAIIKKLFKLVIFALIISGFIYFIYPLILPFVSN